MPYGPAGPYGAPPGPYGQPRRTTNGLAIGSLVSGIVCCLPPLGLILGLVALPQIRKRGQAGKGLAIAGMALSVVSCLLVVLGFVSGNFSAVVDGMKEGVDKVSRARSPESLRIGQCFDDPDKSKDFSTGVTIVDCAKPHDGEVTGTFRITEFGAWPGEDDIEKSAETGCEKINADYALDTWAIPLDVWIFYYMPSKPTWRAGDRNVVCALASDKKPFSGSVRSDESMLDSHQRYFLLTVNVVETLVYQEPEDGPDEDFAANRTWAGEVREAVDKARTDLSLHTWPDDAKPHVEALRKQLGKASAEFGKLAGAADAEGYWEAYDGAWEALPDDLGAAARTALDLTDEPPADAGTSV
ncbi:MULTISPECIES: DUF4190 domain-containing protein [unclassified Streptomyces]|uniref:DUF4190 domain-containing protein n=1 Tax=unclassified Streptomyces TaxID=2593676 RepID=UPI0016604E7F|nr:MULTISPECIES: DUF4190 domain-containing protein [unclassified Streptomyces]MBD0707496.1 hypothetical protein [Streptomyces sp. CBMA291]MBD0715219.1 hypothetical protein [Streptomyces sp. CBMA370]